LTVSRIVLCVMLPQVFVALQNPALDAERYRLCTNVQASRSRAAARCPLYGQSGEANAVLCGKSDFRRRCPLDSVQVHAQHRSYTNK
jgi:hypothetical protein